MWLKNIFEDFSTALDETDARNSVAKWGRNARYGQPRHADWKIEAGGGYAAEEW